MDPSAALFVFVFLTVFVGSIYVLARAVIRSARIQAARFPAPGSHDELLARINRVDHDRYVAEYRRESADRT